MGVFEVIRPSIDEVKKVEILFKNQTRTISKKDDIKEFLNFLAKYKIKRDKNNETIGLSKDIYV